MIAALKAHPVYSDVINKQFKAKLRNVSFHFTDIILRESVENLRLLFSHLYEHCRQELAASHSFPALTQPFRVEDRISTEFVSLIRTIIGINKFANEDEKTIVEGLPNLKIYLDTIITYFNQHPESHSQGPVSRETALAIRGNAIGLLIAQISSATMAIAECRVKGTTVGTNSLTVEQRKKIKAKYERYIHIGNQFRHAEILYTELPRRFRLKKTHAAQASIVSQATTRSLIHDRISRATTPLIEAEEVFSCIRQGLVEMLALFLKQDLDNPTKIKALRLALRTNNANHLQMVRLLIESGIELNDIDGNELPLILETVQTKPETENHLLMLLKLLVDIGNVDINASDRDGQTVLFVAIIDDMPEVAEWIMNHPKSDLRSDGIHLKTLKMLTTHVATGRAFESHILLMQSLQQKMGINRRPSSEAETADDSSIKFILHGFSQLRLEDRLSPVFNVRATERSLIGRQQFRM